MLTPAEINTKITGIRTSAANLRKNLHEVLTNLAGHVYEHGDVRPVEKQFVRLLDDSIRGVDIDAVMGYMTAQCFVRISRDKQTGSVTVTLNKTARKDADFESGDALIAHLNTEVAPWYELTKTVDEALKDLDPATRIRSIAKQIADTGKYNLVFKKSEFDSACDELVEAIAARQREDNRALAVVSEVAEGRAEESAEEAKVANG